MKGRKINSIIFNNTMYYNNQYMFYPSVVDLRRIFNEICECRETTQYVSVTPFYRNAKKNIQVEFDDYMLYLECRDFIDEGDSEKHIANCFGCETSDLTSEKKQIGRVQYPLCRFDDSGSFTNAIREYEKYLFKTLPLLLEKARISCGINDDDIAFGYFAFEIHSE